LKRFKSTVKKFPKQGVVADAGRTEGRSTKQISLNHRPRTGSLAKANPYPAVINPKI